jgi:hypothetical protein
MYTAGSATVNIYTPSGSPDPTWVPTITTAPSSVQHGNSYTLFGRQINGLTQCVYYGNDATQATNYPLVRLRSGSDVYYCRTHTFSTMGLQTGSIVHNCRFTVPASVPVGSYCLEVVANGISSVCKTVGVTNKWFKELKYEIKEKLEIVENLKEIRDTVAKRVPDIDDIKGIRENIDIFEKIQEEWVQQVRTLAEHVDIANEELSRTFITPDRRPEVGPPPPIIEKLDVPRISAEAARIGQQKTAFNDGREEIAISKEAAEFREVVHSLARSGGKVDDERIIGGGAIRPAKKHPDKATSKTTLKQTPPKKQPPKRAPAKKSPTKKATRPRKAR